MPWRCAIASGSSPALQASYTSGQSTLTGAIRASSPPTSPNLPSPYPASVPVGLFVIFWGQAIEMTGVSGGTGGGAMRGFGGAAYRTRLTPQPVFPAERSERRDPSTDPVG